MTRVALGVAGCLIAGFGAFKLWSLGLSDLWQTALWLGGGVIAHDALFAPVVVVAGVAGAALLPRWARGPVTVGAIVLGTVTIAVSPTLAQFGARPDLPSLLDRPYGLGWAVFAGIVGVGIAWGCVRGRRNLRTSSAKE